MNNLVAAYFSSLFVDILSFYLQSDSKKILLSHIFSIVLKQENIK